MNLPINHPLLSTSPSVPPCPIGCSVRSQSSTMNCPSRFCPDLWSLSQTSRRSVAPRWCLRMTPCLRRLEGDTLSVFLTLGQHQLQPWPLHLFLGGCHRVRHGLQLRLPLPARKCHVQDRAPSGPLQARLPAHPGALHTGCGGFHPRPGSHHAPGWDASALGRPCLQRWALVFQFEVVTTCKLNWTVHDLNTILSVDSKAQRSFPRRRPW